MARVFQSGAELGAGSLGLISHATGASVVTSPVRNGNYAFMVQTPGPVIQFSSVTEIYLRCGVWNSSTSSYPKIYFREGMTEHISVHLDPNMPFTVKRGSTTIATARIVPYSRWFLLEVRVLVHDTSGVVQVRVDGEQIIDFSGDTREGATGIVDNIAFGTSTISATTFFDDIAINDTSGTVNNSWCGNGYEKAIKVNGAGDVTQLTPSAGSNYECVDDLPHDSDTTYVESDTVDQYDLYNLEASGLGSNEVVNAITAVAIAKLADVGSGNLAVGIKSGTTTDWGDDTVLSSDYYKAVSKIYETNPDDGGAWEAADLDALQVGVKVR